MNECKLVEDLLPLYAEDLVSRETAEFICEHSSRCERCRTLLERSKEVVPMKTQNNKDYKKALHRGIIKTSLKGAVIAIVVVCLIALLVVAGNQPLGKTYLFESHDGVHSFEITYWGGIYGFLEGMSNYKETARGSKGQGGGFYPWQDILDARWSPDGTDLFLTVELTNDEIGMYIWYHQYDLLQEDGGLHSYGGWLGLADYAKSRGKYYNLTDEFTKQCTADPDFPTGWEDITYTFDSWDENGELIYIRYKTDNGYEGIMTYDFYSAFLAECD